MNELDVADLGRVQVGARRSHRWLRVGSCAVIAVSPAPTSKLRPASGGRPISTSIPLALQAHCAGHTIWAYSKSHIEHMLAYIEATIRERAVPTPPHTAVPASLLEKMPGWFGATSNRTVVSRALRDLRDHSEK